MNTVNSHTVSTPLISGSVTVLRRTLVSSALFLCAALLAACGGGGGGGGGGVAALAPAATPIPPSSQFQGALLSTATAGGALTGDWNAATCTDSRQKNWVRSFLNEKYLFYRDAPLTSIDPNTYSGAVESLFDAYTINGVPAKDRFSFVLTQAEADGTFVSGTPTDAGFVLRRDNNNGGIIRIAYVDPGSSAAAAGFMRGQVLATVDGASTAFSITQAQFDKLFNSPTGTTSVVGVQDSINAPIHNLTATTAAYSSSPLLTSFITPATSITPATGYIAFSSFATPIGEVQLADTFKTFANAGVTSLIVDLRYNGGGYIDIASQMGYMVAGQARTSNRAFETLIYNDKRTAENGSIPFTNIITNFFGNDARANEPLAALNLNTIYVLATGSTCSASEAFVSGLRGVNVQVVIIGSGNTCGKPYGFSQVNNCTLAYFALEFQGQNDQGAVVPVSGLAPTCQLSDDFDHQLGDPNERMLSGAFFHRFVHSCPAVSVAPTAPLFTQASQAADSSTFSGLLNAGGARRSLLNTEMEFAIRPGQTNKLYRSRP